jgi:small subunit ribosomal protein S6
MRLYEVGYIINADLAAEDIQGVIERVQGWVETNDGAIAKIDQWGRRRLAYEIAGNRDGFYVFMYAELPPQAVQELERNMRLAEDILRYLVIRADN